MAARNTISRITSRIDELAERLTPNRGPITIVGCDEAECRARLREIEARGMPVQMKRTWKVWRETSVRSFRAPTP
jgi:hypothetical protein